LSNTGLANPTQVAGSPGSLLPLRAWMRNPVLRSWPFLLFVALVAAPPAGLVIIGPNPTAASFRDASWVFAAYFAVAWLLLIGVIVRPAQISRQLLAFVVVIALVTQIPLALALEAALHANSSNLLSSVLTIGLSEELAKAIPIAVVAVMLRNRLSPVDYLFLGAVSGLAFGASEVVRYFTSGFGIGRESPGNLVLDYVWRFLTDPVTHACWAGLTGYFIGLAVSGQRKWYRVGWIGLAMAMILHGLNDWDVINSHATWVVVVAVSSVLFLSYAKAGPALGQQLNQPPTGTAPQYPPSPAPSVPAVPTTGASWYATQPGSAPAAQPTISMSSTPASSTPAPSTPTPTVPVSAARPAPSNPGTWWQGAGPAPAGTPSTQVAVIRRKKPWWED
jgi:RsiW-degrading membrane proteinase PrsW (M82 family)